MHFISLNAFIALIWQWNQQQKITGTFSTFISMKCFGTCMLWFSEISFPFRPKLNSFICVVNGGTIVIGYVRACKCISMNDTHGTDILPYAIKAPRTIIMNTWSGDIVATNWTKMLLFCHSLGMLCFQKPDKAYIWIVRARLSQIWFLGHLIRRGLMLIVFKLRVCVCVCVCDTNIRTDRRLAKNW